MFSQLWVVNVVTNTGASVPAAFFLLPDKRTPTYKFCLEQFLLLGIQPPPKIYIDFEGAEIKAVKQTFKNPNLKLVGCDTHWKRNIRKQLGQKGLLEEYNSNTDLQRFIRKLWGLCMVPEQDIIKIYTEYIVPAIPFREIPDEVDDEDRNNSNESSHSEDKEYNECLTDFKGYYEGY